MPDRMLDHVLDTLDRHRQRATSGVVAEFVGLTETELLVGRPRNARHSWIVNRVTLLPSGFPREQWHPELRARPGVLHTLEQLDAFLRNPR